MKMRSMHHQEPCKRRPRLAAVDDGNRTGVMHACHCHRGVASASVHASGAVVRQAPGWWWALPWRMARPSSTRSARAHPPSSRRVCTNPPQQQSPARTRKCSPSRHALNPNLSCPCRPLSSIALVARPDPLPAEPGLLRLHLHHHLQLRGPWHTGAAAPRHMLLASDMPGRTTIAVRLSSPSEFTTCWRTPDLAMELAPSTA